jgi:cell division protein FtsB
MTNATTKYKITDKETKLALDHIEKKAEEGKNGNYEMKENIKKTDVNKLTTGKRYIDTVNKRIVIRIGSALFYSTLTELT